MVENELKAFVLKSLSNDPAILYNLMKVYFEDTLCGTTVGLQLDGGLGKSPYLIDVAFKENDIFSVRVYTDDFFYLKKSTLSGGSISTLPKIIQEIVNRIITYLKITGFNLCEDYYG
jgi:hypothetical protein